MQTIYGNVQKTITNRDNQWKKKPYPNAQQGKSKTYIRKKDNKQ